MFSLEGKICVGKKKQRQLHWFSVIDGLPLLVASRYGTTDEVKV